MPSSHEVPTSAAVPRLRVQLLDGVVLLLGDEVVDLGAARPRSLLARLALEPRTPVPIAVLAAELWSDPPPSAGVTLRSVVSRLRTGGLRDRLRGGRGGYTLDVDPDDVDVVAIRTGLRDLPAGSERRALLERFERSWTGRAFAGIDAPFSEREAARIADEYTSAMTELADCRMGEGDDERAIASLRDLVQRDPLADRPVALLATALARTGRDGEALRAIDELAHRLEHRWGLDLPAPLLALRTSILRRDVALGGDLGAPERVGVPSPITGFVGRRAELAAVLDARAQSRLVTIVGPGGVGKTRLAIEAVRRDVRDARQVFVDLVPFRDLPSTLSAVADLVGALRPDLDTIAATLRDAPTLLVLDNAEHLRDAVATLVDGLLARVDGLTVLVTSRDPLRVPGERRVRIEPFAGDALEDAVELFAARAAEIDGGFRLGATTEPLVRSLAAAVDGIPLALELAAARLPTRSLVELVAEVRARGLAGRASARGRHASVTAMIEWSTDLLSPAERDLLVQLGGFAGTFSHEAATEICEVPGEDVDDLLLELVDRSLVATSRTADGATEYRLLIAVRQVARRLSTRDPAPWRERHRRWHARLVDDLRPALYSSEEERATAILERASHDLSAALADCVAASDRESALLIVGGMARVWYRRSSLVEGAARLEEALAIPGKAAAIVEARARLGLGLLRFFMREPEAAGAAIDAAITHARVAGDPSILAVALAYRGYLDGALGAGDAARASVAEAAALAGQSPAAAATVGMIVADLQRAAGAPATALAGLERAHRLARQAGEQWVVTLSAHLTAKVLIASRRGREAIDLLVPVIRDTWESGRPTHTIAGIVLVAAATTVLEQHAAGARLLAAADAHARRYSWDPDANDPEGNRVHRTRLRAALTADEWRAALAAGSRLTLAEAVAGCAALASTEVRRRVAAA